MSSLDVRFFVDGIPVPKGNHDAFPIGRGPCPTCKGTLPKRCGKPNCFGGTIVGTTVTDDKGAELKAWEGVLRIYGISARNRAAAAIVTKPRAVELFLVFLVPRPAGHYTGSGAVSAAGERQPMPVTKPDWDKLSRAACDALTGSLYEDDSQIVAARVSKAYVRPSRKPGVLVRVREVHADPDWVGGELAALGLGEAIDPPSTQGALF